MVVGEWTVWWWRWWGSNGAERSVWASHVGTQQALYTLQWHCKIFCESYKQTLEEEERGGGGLQARKTCFDNW